MSNPSKSLYDAAAPRGSDVWPVIVVGAGAAGLMAGLFAARAGARVLMLESGRRPGTKIRISGGGRCNVLPSTAHLNDFVSTASANTLRNMLSAWPLGAVRDFFELDLGVALKQEATGKLFPASDRAQDVIDALVDGFIRAPGTLRCNARVKHISRRPVALGADDHAGHFDVVLASGERLAACRVVLATGGLSVPATGSDGAGLRMALSLGHSLRATSPALVPLLGDSPELSALKGLCACVTLTARHNHKTVGCAQGDFLFTHRGYSGPAVLNISRYIAAHTATKAPNAAPSVPEAPMRLYASWPLKSGGADWEAALKSASGAMTVGSFVRGHLPRRLADVLIARAEVDGDRRLGCLQRQQRLRLVAQLGDCALPVTGDEGYRTAEVTQGGIGLDELHVKTFESRLQPHLYIAGEALDVIGKLGGYNFLWAWVSGRRAGQAAGLQSARPDAPAALCAQSPAAESAA